MHCGLFGKGTGKRRPQKLAVSTWAIQALFTGALLPNEYIMEREWREADAITVLSFGWVGRAH